MTAGADIEVRAKSAPTLDSEAIGGSLSSLFSASVGVAFSITDSEARAIIGAATVETTDGAINVSARTKGDVDSRALGLAAGGTIAVGGAVTANLISNTTIAAIDGAGSVTSPTSVSVTATDRSSLMADSGQLAASFGAAIGIASAINAMTNSVQAHIAGALVTTHTGNVDLQLLISAPFGAVFVICSAISFENRCTSSNLSSELGI